MAKNSISSKPSHIGTAVHTARRGALELEHPRQAENKVLQAVNSCLRLDSATAYRFVQSNYRLLTITDSFVRSPIMQGDG